MNDSQRPPVSFDRKNKDTKRTSQLQTIFHYLQSHVATASMANYATGIPITSITRIKRDLELSGQLWEVGKTYCELTGHKAWFLSTAPEKAPNSFDTRLAFTF